MRKTTTGLGDMVLFLLDGSLHFRMTFSVPFHFFVKAIENYIKAKKHNECDANLRSDQQDLE